MKKIISLILCVSPLCVSALAYDGEQLRISAEGDVYTNQPHGLPVWDKAKTEDMSIFTLDEDENAVVVRFSSEEEKLMEYYIALYSVTEEKYITQNSVTGMPANMVGPISEGEFVFTGLTGGNEYEVIIATAVNSRKLNVNVYTAKIDAATEFTVPEAVVSGNTNVSLNDAGLNLAADSTVTRAEMAMLVKNLLPEETTRVQVYSATGDAFSDISSDKPYYYIVDDLCSLKVLSGMGDGTFMPDASVTNAQAIKMIISLMGYGAQADVMGGWPSGYLTVGASLGITTENPDSETTWAEVEQMLARAMVVPHLNVSAFDAVGSMTFYQNPNMTYANMR